MNLLPKTEKENLKKGFRLRFFVVASFLAAVSFLIAFVMLLPSYFMTLGYFSNAVQKGVDLSAEDRESMENILNLPQEIDYKLKFFQTNTNQIPATDSLYKIIGQLPSGVAIKSVSFTRDQNYNDKTGTIILISGTAFDRDSLVFFSKKLEETNYFSSVEVPVGSLTKGRNLPFSMNVFIEN